MQRPIFVHGLNGLKLPHTEVDASKWHEVVPDGGVLVVDEVQQIWRPRGPGQKPTLDISSLETHRHRNIDIYLTTQGPALVDANVRALVGRHIHLREMGWLGRWWYEWPECSAKVAWRTAPIKKRYKLPKQVFGLYTSASGHTKPQRSFPWLLALFGATVVAVAAGSWYAVNRIGAKIAPSKGAEQLSGAGKVPGVVGGGKAASLAPKLPFIEELSAKYRPRLSYWYTVGGVTHGAVEWWDGANIREVLTFKQVKQMGAEVILRGDAAMIGATWITAWPIPRVGAPDASASRPAT